MNQYLLNENGEEFILEVHTMEQAKRNADFYNAIVIGRIYEPFGKEYFPRDLNHDWSKHIYKTT